MNGRWHLITVTICTKCSSK